jgi:dihydroorotate dehydrogenase (NAD+) catalytic subunit
MAAQVTAAVRAATRMPVWVKMSPEAGDLVGVAKACEGAGADAVTAINTIRGMVIDVANMRPKLANATGGLSGPALRPIAVRMVWELAGALQIPVIGIGGITNARDALEFLLAGASAVQVGTANFRDPCSAQTIMHGIRDFCDEHQCDVAELIGRARR